MEHHGDSHHASNRNDHWSVPRVPVAVDVFRHDRGTCDHCVGPCRRKLGDREPMGVGFRRNSSPCGRAQELARGSGAVVLAGAFHLVLVLSIGVWDRRWKSTQSDGRGWLVGRATTWLLIVVSLVFFLVTIQQGSIQDYYLYGQIWEQILKGNDPWFLVFGGSGSYPLNAYGPLYTVLALPTALNPLAPKLFFAFAYWLFVAWLVKDLGASRRLPGWAGLALVLWHANPYVWVEIAAYGHFDVLVGILCIAAVEARLQERRAESVAWLASGVLLKFFPAVLTPFLMLDKGRIQSRYVIGTIALVVAGMTTACLIWGATALRPITFAMGRESAHLSIFRYLSSPISPIGRDTLFFSPDQWASPILLAALFKTWTWTRRVRFETAASCVLVVTVTLLLYKVGFPQYPMVLFMLGPYWLVRESETLSHKRMLTAAFCGYFAWIAYFDVMMYRDRIAQFVEWVGVPTFILGSLLIVCIIRSGPCDGAVSNEVAAPSA